MNAPTDSPAPLESLDPWPQRALAPLDLIVGPCAWRVTLLSGPEAEAVRARPSLVVVAPDDGDDVLRAAAPHLAGLPVLLRLREPAFARHLPDLLGRRFEALGRSRVEAVSLEVEDVSELKAGGMIHTLRQWREAGRIGHIGVGHEDPRHAEWLAKNTPGRLLVLPWGLADQAVRYRALAAAKENEMACVAAAPADAGVDPADAGAQAALRFALGASSLVLPVFERPLPPGLTPMSAGEVEAAWAGYEALHAAPEPLPRGQPPE